MARRLTAAGIVAGLAYTLLSGVLHPQAFREHLDFLFGEGSKPYRSGAGVLGLLRDAGLMTAVGAGRATAVLGALGVLVLALRRRSRGLLLLAPAVSYGLLFLLPAGYVYLRFALPLVLAAALSAGFLLEWGEVQVTRRLARGRPRIAVRVLLALAVIAVLLPAGLEVVVLKRGDPRREAMAELARLREPGEEVWLAPQPFMAAPYPLPDPPFEVVDGVAVEETRPEWLVVSLFQRSQLEEGLALEEGAVLPVPLLGSPKGGVEMEVARVFTPDEKPRFGQHVEIQATVVLLRRR